MLPFRNKKIVIGVGGAIAVVVILVVVLATTGVFKSDSDAVFVRCEGDECQQQSQRLVKYTRLDVDPCQDFEKFTCGNYQASLKLPNYYVQTDEKRLLREKVKKIIDEVLNEEDEDDDPEYIAFVKKAYKECTKNKNGTYDNLLTIQKNMVAQAKRSNKIAVLLSYGQPAVLSVDVKRDPFKPNENILWLSPPKFGLHPKIFQRANLDNNKDPKAIKMKKDYIKWMNMSYISLTNDSDEKLTERIVKAVELESKLALLSLKDAKDYKMKNSVVKKTLIDLGIVDDPTSLFAPFLNQVSSRAASKAHFNDETEVIVENVNYITNFMAEIRKHDKQVVEDYLSIRLIQTWHYTVDPTFAEMDGHWGLNQFEEVDSTSRCINAIKKNAPMVLGHLYLMKNPPKASTVKNATELVNHINSVLQRAINNTQWITNVKDRKVLKNKLKKMKVQVGYPAWILRGGKALENTTDLTKPNEEDNATTLITKMERVAFAMKLNSLGPVDKEEWQVSPAEVDVSYDHLTNTLSVPMAILNPPFFHEHVTHYLNYAGLGVEVAKNLLKAVGWNGIDFYANGSIAKDDLHPFTKEFVDSHTNKFQCYIDVYKGIKYPKFGLKAEAKRTIDENVADNEALKLAHMAFKNSSFVADLKLPSDKFDKFSDDQLFFISYGSSRCHDIREKVLYPQIVTADASPLSNRTTVALSNYLNFTQSLSCNEESQYVPGKGKKTCSIWF